MIKKNKIDIINEFLVTKNSGFIDKISIQLEEEFLISFDPDTITFKQEFIEKRENITEKSIKNVDNLPDYNYLIVNFYEYVENEVIKKVAKYCSKKYNCKYLIELHDKEEIKILKLFQFL